MLFLLSILLFLEQPPLLQQGLQALQAGRLAEAQTDLEQVTHAEPDNAYAWVALAQVYARTDQPKLAAEAADHAEKLGRQNPVIAHALSLFYFERAQPLLRQQHYTEAADLLQHAISTHPDDPQLVLALGVARYGQRRFDDAITAFLKVIQLDPEAEQPYVFLGRMLDQAGSRLPEITRDDEAWAAREPQNAKADLVLAKALLIADSRSERAESLLRRSIELEPKDWESHFELGVWLSNRHRYDDAAHELEEAASLDPKEPMPHYHLARVYDRLGKPDEARVQRQTHARLTAPQ